MDNAVDEVLKGSGWECIEAENDAGERVYSKRVNWIWMRGLAGDVHGGRSARIL